MAWSLLATPGLCSLTNADPPRPAGRRKSRQLTTYPGINAIPPFLYGRHGHSRLRSPLGCRTPRQLPQLPAHHHTPAMISAPPRLTLAQLARHTGPTIKLQELENW